MLSTMTLRLSQIRTLVKKYSSVDAREISVNPPEEIV